MDDWITDSGSEGGEEGENPLAPRTLETPTHGQASYDVGSEAVSQEALSELLDAPLTEEEVEMNFEFDDYEIVDTEPAHTRPASDQTPEALVGTERPLQQPAAREPGRTSLLLGRHRQSVCPLPSPSPIPVLPQAGPFWLAQEK